MPYGIHRRRKPSANRLTSCLSSSALRAASSPEPDIDTESPRDGLGPPSGGVESLATAPVPTPPRARLTHAPSLVGTNAQSAADDLRAGGRSPLVQRRVVASQTRCPSSSHGPTAGSDPRESTALRWRPVSDRTRLPHRLPPSPPEQIRKRPRRSTTRRAGTHPTAFSTSYRLRGPPGAANARRLREEEAACWTLREIVVPKTTTTRSELRPARCRRSIPAPASTRLRKAMPPPSKRDSVR